MEIYRIVDKGKQGYLAVSGNKGVKFFGDKYGNAFAFLTDFSCLETKTVRSAKTFDKYVKMAYPNARINPIDFGVVLFDNPFLHYSNGACVKWSPYFEEGITKSSFSVTPDGSILEYNYCEPIYVSALSMRRHTSAFQRERLLVNLQNGYTTRELDVANANLYSCSTYHVEGNVWVCDSSVKTPIAGYKSR